MDLRKFAANIAALLGGEISVQAHRSPNRYRGVGARLPGLHGPRRGLRQGRAGGTSPPAGTWSRTAARARARLAALPSGIGGQQLLRQGGEGCGG